MSDRVRNAMERAQTDSILAQVAMAQGQREIGLFQDLEFSKRGLRRQDFAPVRSLQGFPVPGRIYPMGSSSDGLRQDIESASATMPLLHGGAGPRKSRQEQEAAQQSFEKSQRWLRERGTYGVGPSIPAETRDRFDQAIYVKANRKGRDRTDWPEMIVQNIEILIVHIEQELKWLSASTSSAKTATSKETSNTIMQPENTQSALAFSLSEWHSGTAINPESSTTESAALAKATA